MGEIPKESGERREEVREVKDVLVLEGPQGLVFTVVSFKGEGEATEAVAVQGPPELAFAQLGLSEGRTADYNRRTLGRLRGPGKTAQIAAYLGLAMLSLIGCTSGKAGVPHGSGDLASHFAALTEADLPNLGQMQTPCAVVQGDTFPNIARLDLDNNRAYEKEGFTYIRRGEDGRRGCFVVAADNLRQALTERCEAQRVALDGELYQDIEVGSCLIDGKDIFYQGPGEPFRRADLTEVDGQLVATNSRNVEPPNGSSFLSMNHDGDSRYILSRNSPESMARLNVDEGTRQSPIPGNANCGVPHKDPNFPFWLLSQEGDYAGPTTCKMTWGTSLEDVIRSVRWIRGIMEDDQGRPIGNVEHPGSLRDMMLFQIRPRAGAALGEPEIRFVALIPDVDPDAGVPDDAGQPQVDGGQIPVVDAGQPPADGGQIPVVDAGQPQADAGQPQADAGQPQADAGQPQADAGQPQSDAGQPQADAGQPQADAGQPQADAGQPQADASQPQADASQPQADLGQPQADAGQPQADAGQPPVDGGSDLGTDPLDLGQPVCREAAPGVLELTAGNCTLQFCPKEGGGDRVSVNGDGTQTCEADLYVNGRRDPAKLIITRDRNGRIQLACDFFENQAPTCETLTANTRLRIEEDGHGVRAMLYGVITSSSASKFEVVPKGMITEGPYAGKFLFEVTSDNDPSAPPVMLLFGDGSRQFVESNGVTRGVAVDDPETGTGTVLPTMPTCEDGGVECQEADVQPQQRDAGPEVEKDAGTNLDGATVPDGSEVIVLENEGCSCSTLNAQAGAKGMGNELLNALGLAVMALIARMLKKQKSKK